MKANQTGKVWGSQVSLMKAPRNQSDIEFDDFFQDRLQHVFLYITNRCDLRCEQCFYTTQLGNTDMSLDHARAHLIRCYGLGARRLTLLGGEPTLYDIKNEWQGLANILHHASQIGYESIRLDTNGQFPAAFLDFVANFPTIDLSFSLDGNEDENDKLRGSGVFRKATHNLKKAIARNNVSVTICVSSRNVKTIRKDVCELMDLGVNEINFHPLLLVGNHQDRSIGDSCLTPSEWLDAHSSLCDLAARHPSTNFRVPVRFLKPNDRLLGQDYCSIRTRDRVHIQPNGDVRICPLSVGGLSKTGKIVGGSGALSTDRSETNELGTRRCMVSTNASKGLVATCVSFKPMIELFGQGHEPLGGGDA